jgi:glycerol-3-phosphate acyltransferase PlsY
VGLGSLLATLAVALLVGTGHFSPRAPLLTFALLALLLILYTHRGNIKRMRSGTESRARRLWLFARRTP